MLYIKYMIKYSLHTAVFKPQNDLLTNSYNTHSELNNHKSQSQTTFIDISININC